MSFSLRHFVYFFSFFFCVWISYATYDYFFDTTLPQLTIVGLESEAYYASDVTCSLSSNKAGTISITLDGQQLISEFKIKKDRAHQFEIPTKSLSDGKHVLCATCHDTRFAQNSSSFECEFIVDNMMLQAAFTKPEAEYRVFQGRTLHVQFQVNKEVKNAQVHALSHSYPCFVESENSRVYEAFIPISCEENPNEYLFTIDVTDNVGNSLRLDNKFTVVMYPFKKTRIAIAKEKIEQEEKHGENERLFEQEIKKLTQESINNKLWRGAFITPIEIQRVTTEFGTVRTTQHKGRYAHKALDVINAPKSVVWAPQDGTVVMKKRFQASGNTVVIDHGCGVLSLLFHLEDYANINEGDVIAKGNPVGTLGKTGFASGYHLHWEMRVNNIPIDPMQWTKTTF